jgi:hypothetical protein
MPLILASILFGGTFFGYSGADSAHQSMKAANIVQQHFLDLKQAAISKVAIRVKETN